jgi:hypothetical protein
MHTCSHTPYIYTHITQTRAHHTWVPMNTHICTHVYTHHTHTCKNMHTHIYTYTQHTTHRQIHITHMHTYAHTCTRITHTHNVLAYFATQQQQITSVFEWQIVVLYTEENRHPERYWLLTFPEALYPLSTLLCWLFFRESLASRLSQFPFCTSTCSWDDRSAPLQLVIGWDGISWTFCPGWPRTTILLVLLPK